MDPPQLGSFCREQWPRLVGMLSLYTGDRDVAQDLAQDALLRACTHWDRVAAMDAPSAWVHRVALNLANSHFRRRAAFRRARARAGVPRLASASEVDTADVLAVRGAVAALPEPQRRALVLRYYADLPVREVAQLMRCPSNTVKTHTRRAIEALRVAGLLDERQESAPRYEEEENAG